ncbi:MULTISPECIES: ABC transporter ATP-binding protein [unclassified Bacillus (in: firmicutes)]|uniref:ABC transporter ATP-binding protein n=1 Tax=unclassified Bacillus (in: firmicutes) TaxID=185979 RepID=UPI0008F2A341|nr:MULTISPECIES: ABC transporter ATP-binding protein [unclassified Bacillus (in: firmicutes)]PGZ93261.1 ABC transporter ATP-binding protein [Bacillus sp. AFS029533]SFD22780.1 ABC-2 type transport system ATP-binding protein [Bacillus sp. UNCCL81]
MNKVLKLEGVTKSIKGKVLVDNVSFEVNEGEVFGFLGPNGAGKTTTIRMLVGLIKPTKGTIEIAGYPVKTHFKEAMRQIGCIVENPELYGYLTGWENLNQFARMLGIRDDKKISEVVNLVKLTDRIHEKVKTYSLGMKQRLGIAQALLGGPKLLILDEPTNGLDPAGIRELREFIHMLVKEQNISVFISSHLLSEIEMICDRVGIINKGKMVRVSTVKELVKEAAERVEWRVSPIQKGLDLLKKDSTIQDILVKDELILCRMSPLKINEVIQQFVAADVQVNGVKTMSETLEDLFMEMTGGEVRG